jgi:propionate CoA-transferase
MFITERAVLVLEHGQLILAEVAPGIDIARDILAVSDAGIVVPAHVPLMAAAIFNQQPMHHTDPFSGYTN